MTANNLRDAYQSTKKEKKSTTIIASSPPAATKGEADLDLLMDGITFSVSVRTYSILMTSAGFVKGVLKTFLDAS
ncbi:hypothetical protein NPIL_466871 [Nephila pilipes]|uniref:Uncharacterized protein n=1 Tax=Nephila pilipes TaxID=299642 RepID=A0A8X6PU63_NEPPI|nr:hypothetical protein NPIL_466871 [Nephila pilipes]